MDVRFANIDLQSLCECQRRATGSLGKASARRLRTRLSDLLAVYKVGDLIAGHPHPLKGDRQGEFAINLAGGDRIVFKCNQDPIPKTDTGHIDWRNVTSVMITYIGDYHD